jgi:hypothetical protein
MILLIRKTPEGGADAAATSSVRSVGGVLDAGIMLQTKGIYGTEPTSHATEHPARTS